MNLTSFSSLLTYLLYGGILIALINIYFVVAKHYNIVDKPSARSSHKNLVIRGGGIIFPIGILLWSMLSGFKFPLFIIGLVIISLISFFDDIKPVSFKIRLILQIFSLILLIKGFGEFTENWWIWIFLLICLTGLVNIFNFMDGINGMTGLYCISIFVGFYIVNNFQVHFIPNEILFFMIISLVVFAFYNIRINAKCFAGDVGSVSIAFIISFLMGKLVLTSGNIFYIMFFSIYTIDALLTIIIRLIRKENIFHAHRKHLYQLLANEIRVPQLFVSSGYALIQMLIIFLIIFSNVLFTDQQKLFTTFFVLIFLVILYFIIRKKITKKLQY